MRLIAAAYDGDAECVSGLLETGVPVDVTKPVRPDKDQFSFIVLG